MQMLKMFVALSFLFLVGCAQNVIVPETPREKLAAAEATFITIVQQLNIRKEAGVFSVEQLDSLKQFVAAGSQLLDAAHLAVDRDDPESVNTLLIQLNKIVIQLRAMQQENANGNEQRLIVGPSYARRSYSHELVDYESQPGFGYS